MKGLLLLGYDSIDSDFLKIPSFSCSLISQPRREWFEAGMRELDDDESDKFLYKWMKFIILMILIISIINYLYS